MDEIEKLNAELMKCNTQVFFSHNSLRDYKRYPNGSRKVILALILKQAMKGAMFQPKGNGKQLNPPLHQFAKIKPRAMSMRIVYRPVEKVINGQKIVEMQLIAIGPKDREEVYNLALKRLDKFFEEIRKRDQNKENH
ncbi:hypothetical protein [Ectobacillus antri]|uniref:hypothetical protein n=1 Tax=Ectobacillus antri TaxID=2486280 RepID=UPI000F593214|nr:hypothetical protein [Ectobacillus antri]